MSLARVRPGVLGVVCGLGLGWVIVTPAVLALPMMPRLVLLSPGDGANASGRITLAAQADAEGLVSLQFQVDGKNQGSPVTEGPCVAPFDTTTTTDGPHTIHATAVDEFGNVSVSPPVAIFVNNLVPAAPPVNDCVTPDPFVAFGGGRCVNGGWLFPNMLVPGPVAAPTPPASSPSACLTPDPFVAFGGGVCVNGGWRFPGTADRASSVAPTPVPTPTGCLTPDPFVALGGGRCVNGGWLPPGIR